MKTIIMNQCSNDFYIHNRINSILSQIINELLKYKPELIIFHGSAANNLENPSDIDLIIVSEIFKNIIFFDRIKYAQNLLYNFKPLKIDVICLIIEEFINSINNKDILYNSLLKGYVILYKNQKVFHNTIF